jgi:OOP family OmpA-OmpF porin
MHTPLLLSLLLALPAHAQDPNIRDVDAHGLQLAALDGDPRDALIVQRPGRLRQWGWFASGVMEYAHAPIVWVQETDEGLVRTPALDHLVTLNLSGGVALHERVRLDVALPLFFGSVGINGVPQGPRVGDLRLTALLLAVAPDPDDQGLGLGISGHFDVPTGAPAVALGQRTVAGGFKVSGTYGWPKWTLGGELGYQLNPAIDVVNLSNPDQLLLGGTVGYLFLPTTAIHLELRVLPAVTPGPVAGTQTPAEVLTSVRHRWLNGAHIVGGIGTAMSPGIGAPRMRAFLGGGFGRHLEQGPPDTDGDGFNDADDACIEEPEDFDGFEDHDGCPDHSAFLAVEVLHQDARLVGTPITLTSPTAPEFKVLSGTAPVRIEVPAESPWLAEARSSCLVGSAEAVAVDSPTDTPIVVRVKPVHDSPVHIEVHDAGGAWVDSTSISWVSAIQECVPKGTTFDGGSLDLEVGSGEHQLLVESPGYGTQRVSVRATPGLQTHVEILLDTTRLRVEDDAIVVLERVYFDTDRSTIRATSYPLLNEMAALLLANPNLGALEIGGHTDNTGRAAHNQELSEERAASVRAYLIHQRVPPARLKATGYGESRPIDDNNTEAGKEKNRRVEFRRLDTGSELRGKITTSDSSSR